MLGKLLIDHRISTLYICKCLLVMHNKGVLIQRLSYGDGHHLSRLAQKSAHEPQALHFHKRRRHRPELLLQFHVPCIPAPFFPFIDHCFRICTVFICDGFVAPVILIGKPGNVISLAMVLFSGQLHQLLPLVNIVTHIPVCRHQKLPRIVPTQKFIIHLGKW